MQSRSTGRCAAILALALLLAPPFAAAQAVLLGNGDGTFAASVTVAGGATVPAVVQLPRRVGEPLTLRLQSSDPGIVQVPESVTVARGESSASFTVVAAAVKAPVTVRVSTDLRSVSSAALHVVPPPVVVQVAIAPSPASGGAVVEGKVTLNRVAPAGGAAVMLRSAKPAVAGVPARVVVPPGQKEATFPVQVGAVSQPASVRISAEANGTRSAVLEVVAAASLAQLAVPATQVAPGDQVSGTLSLDRPAPAGGTPVQLASAHPAVRVPAQVVIPVGLAQSGFAIAIDPLPGPAAVQISATLGMVTRTATLMVDPSGAAATIAQLAIGSPVAAGQAAMGLVTLDRGAAPGGTVVALQAAPGGVVAMPASVTVPAGETQATFQVLTSAHAAPATVQVHASTGDVTRTAVLQVNPAQ